MAVGYPRGRITINKIKPGTGCRTKYEMSELKLPTPGCQVYYYPNGSDAHCAVNSAEVLPATAVQVFGSAVNLAVTCMNPDAPVVLRYSVPHLSTAPRNEDGQPVGRYWAWPEIK